MRKEELDQHDEHFEIEMEDPMSSNTVVTTTPHTLSSTLPQYSMNNRSTFSLPKTPEITGTEPGTLHLHNRQHDTADDDSDGATPPSSDEDDYPDQVL